MGFINRLITGGRHPVTCRCLLNPRTGQSQWYVFMPATQRDSDRPLAVVNLGSLLRNMAGVYVGLYNDYLIIIDRRKFRSQTSDNMDRWKAEQGRGREKRKIRRKEDGDARKGRKVAKHCVFPMICGSGGSKSRLAKAAGAEPAGQISDEKLHAVVARSRFPSQNVQNSVGPLLEVEMSKKCTPLWREAHLQVKI